MNWNRLNRRIVACEFCPRLRAWCREIAATKRRAFFDAEYWGLPVPNFGDASARLLIVGLAPAAHGANRTGRMFTGDNSGLWLYRALHKAGFANQPFSNHRADGLVLRDCAITAVCHCAPPANRPTRDEIENCRQWLENAIDTLPWQVVLTLGHVAWQSVLKVLRARDLLENRRVRFAHGALVGLRDLRWLLASYHPSQQNTFTGRLTESMLDSVCRTARHLSDQQAIGH